MKKIFVILVVSFLFSVIADAQEKQWHKTITEDATATTHLLFFDKNADNTDDEGLGDLVVEEYAYKNIRVCNFDPEGHKIAANVTGIPANFSGSRSKIIRQNICYTFELNDPVDEISLVCEAGQSCSEIDVDAFNTQR